MLKRKLLQASSLDEQLIPSVSFPQDGIVVRRYQDVITLRLTDQTICHLVVPSIGDGPHRIVLNTDDLDTFITLQSGLRVQVMDHQLLFANGVGVSWHHAKIWLQAKPHIRLVNRDELSNRCNQRLQEIQRRYPWQQDEALAVQQKIQKFLSQPNASTGQAILGLGSGSTPLGDDAILGYILSQRFFGLMPFASKPAWLEDVISMTTALSAEMLMDAMQGRYSQVFLTWLSSLISETESRGDEVIAQLGGNSGKMMLHSFYTNVCRYLKEETHENISTYTSK